MAKQLSNVFYDLKKTWTQQKNQWTEEPRTDTELAQDGEQRKPSWKRKAGEFMSNTLTVCVMGAL